MIRKIKPIRACGPALLLWHVFALFVLSKSEAADGRTNAAVTFIVTTYELLGPPQMLSDAPSPESFSAFTGRNLPLETIVKAAAALQAEFARKGLAQPSVAISPERITNGLVALHIFRGGEVPRI